MASARPDEPAQIRVRMYRVGFGDCFLVSFPAPGRNHHVLVDCGVHPRGDVGTMGAVVDDIATVTGRRLDVVLATHAHQDHVSGFGSHTSRFSTFEVGEVWMPWTEDPSDPVATELKSRQQILVAKLTSHFAALGGPRFAAVRAVLQALSTNRAAFDLLRAGFRNARVRYLKAGAELSGPAGIAGLSVRILGPSTDPAFLARLDPPAGQRYLRNDGGVTTLADAVRPFDRHWTADPGDPGPALSSADRRALKAKAEDPLASLAFALDRALHDTSLVSLFRVGGRTLLFPGDARLGSWLAPITGSDPGEILSSVDFYKVSQHGSANGTPGAALEGMASASLAAMASTQSRPWTSIPDPKLLAALARHAGKGIVRSDSLPVATRGAPAGPPLGKLPGGFTRGDLWVDYGMPVAS
jgi:beta-lactamase superfamily II metal-dependent hydrolase